MSVATVMCLQRKEVDDILLAMTEVAGPYSSETAFMLQKACNATAEAESKVQNWYEGWAAHEAITLAAYLFKHHYRDPEQAILTAANTPGDSDSIGTLVGALCGAYNGIDSFPQHWVVQLERNRGLYALSNIIHHFRY